MPIPPFLQAGQQKKAATVTTSLRLPGDLVEWVDENAERLNTTRTELIAECIRYVRQLTLEEDEAAKRRAQAKQK